MRQVEYQLADDDVRTPLMGVVVLQVDETIERDLQRLLPGDLARVHVTRISSGTELTRDTIAEMAENLTFATSLLPYAHYDVIAYACTSGTTLIGAQEVAELVRDGRPAAHVTHPLGAAFAAMHHVGAKSLAIVSPYIPTVAEPIRDAFTREGFDVTQSVTFGEKTERNVARIDENSIRNAALKALDGADADCIFLSCTNLKTLDLIDALESETGRIVISSNQALAWHMARLAGVPRVSEEFGKLFSVT